MNENKNTLYDFPTTQVRYEIDTRENEEEEKPDPNFIRHMYLMRTNGKYCLMNTNYDCVYVPEPVSGMSGFMMSSKKYHVEYDKFYRKIGEPWVYQLEYKCKFYGRDLMIIDRFYPSSKTCHYCGYINKNLKLNDREWICPECN